LIGAILARQDSWSVDAERGRGLEAAPYQVESRAIPLMPTSICTGRLSVIAAGAQRRGNPGARRAALAAWTATPF